MAIDILAVIIGSRNSSSMIQATPLLRVILTSLMVALCGCIDPCGDEILQTVVSPDQRTVATIYVRDCGATTSEVTHVHLHGRFGWFSNEDWDNVVLSLRYRHSLKIQWQGSSRLVITCDQPAKDGETFRMARGWRDVVVEYRGCREPGI